ncbi:MAG: SHOCT domain-containing protein [Actinomycetales bacterium]
MDAFLSWLWLILVTFAFAAYLFAMFAIIMDLFRDHSASGWAKAIWVFFLIVFPILTALVYLIARGDGMADRARRDALQQKAATDSYIREVSSQVSPADQIAQAKTLLDAGTISQAEFDTLKAKALS